MKDNNGHILRQISTESLETWIQLLMKTYKDGIYKIQYRGSKTNWYTVLSEHRWDFYGNDYQIIKPRQYVIATKDGEVHIEETSNYLFDYNKNTDGTEYFLMQEVEH